MCAVENVRRSQDSPPQTTWNLIASTIPLLANAYSLGAEGSALSERVDGEELLLPPSRIDPVVSQGTLSASGLHYAVVWRVSVLKGMGAGQGRERGGAIIPGNRSRHEHVSL